MSNVYPARKAPVRMSAAMRDIKSLVRTEIHKNIEDKQATQYAINTRVVTNMPANQSAGIYSVIPSLEDTLSANAGRIGQQVRPQSLSLDATFWLTPTLAGIEYPVYFDLYVFKVRAVRSQSQDIAPQVAQFLRPTTQQAGADTLYVGAAQNFHQFVNTDVIQVLYKKRFKMSTVRDSINQAIFIDNTAVLAGEHTVNLSKHIAKTLMYDNKTDQIPNNDAIFATMVCTSVAASDIAQPLTQFGACTFTSKMTYEDT